MVNERENDRAKKRTCRQCLSRGSVLEINMQALHFHDGAMPCESGCFFKLRATRQSHMYTNDCGAMQSAGKL